MMTYRNIKSLRGNWEKVRNKIFKRTSKSQKANNSKLHYGHKYGVSRTEKNSPSACPPTYSVQNSLQVLRMLLRTYMNIT